MRFYCLLFVLVHGHYGVVVLFDMPPKLLLCTAEERVMWW